MRLASVIHDGRSFAAVLDGERLTPLVGVTELGAQTPISVLREPPLDESASLPLDGLQLRPVIPQPSKVICIGLNYLAHIQETQNQEHDYPVLFTKFASSLTGPFDAIPRPRASSAVDYEGELAVVIGEHTRRVSPQEALRKVAGYTIANDITMRDYQYKTNQWLQGKAWEAATPLGPWLVTPDELGDPQNLQLRTIVNGETVQEASTAQMIFDIPTLISTISEFTSLAAGDVILTGTPSGVGYRREPQLLLSAGDLVAVEVDGIGRIENRVVDEG